mmetsp:Transcript_3387/g.3709  ORF Transcript_3387/g.3709 Transcript_3387/m.3709 type:complete len:94 (+) Transcript_3387:462-743(+)
MRNHHSCPEEYVSSDTTTHTLDEAIAGVQSCHELGEHERHRYDETSQELKSAIIAVLLGHRIEDGDQKVNFRVVDRTENYVSIYKERMGEYLF